LYRTESAERRTPPAQSIAAAPDGTGGAAGAPVSYAVVAARALFNEQLGDPSIPRAVAILGLLAAAALLVASREFRRAAA
jgi:hypothetical protein